MKIIKLQAQNVKRLKAVEITPEGNLVTIGGKNAQGKTSVLDSIWFALGGKRAAKDTPMPVHEGESKAYVKLDLGELVVTRKWTSKGTTSLNVESANGAKHTSPQAVLDALVGELSFDPLAFAQMPTKEQTESLLSVLGLDFEEMDKERKKLYDDRTLVNRDVKQLEAQLEAAEARATVPREGPLPDEELSIDEAMQELNGSHALDMENKEKRSNLERKLSDARQLKEEIEELQRQIDSKQRTLDAMVVEGKALREEVESLADPPIEALQAEINNIEETNKKVRAAKEYRQIQDQATFNKGFSEGLTKKIESLDKQKEDGIRAAKFPIAGLSFDESGVTYNGLPFTQAADSEKLRVSLAIAMALNPKLRVIRITNGSLLDSDNLQLIKNMADAEDYQIWIEMVDESGKVGVVIEDGQVKTTN